MRPDTTSCAAHYVRQLKRVNGKFTEVFDKVRAT